MLNIIRYRIGCLLIIVVFSPFFLMGQEFKEGSINFVSNLSWNQIREKARAENKYIFVDCFTTWCGPCKWMNDNIFGQVKVGSFFNAHFINVRLQMDKNANDDQAIKYWYEDANRIANKYDISAYPTYLFFAPDGEIVHRFVGAAKDENEFIRRASDALDNHTQYYSVIAHWKDHKDDSAYLYHVLEVVAKSDNVEQLHEIATAYVECLKEPLEKTNIHLFYFNSSNDFCFKLMLKNAAKVNEWMGETYVANQVSSTIFKEEVEPLFLKSDPLDWDEISFNIRNKYSMLGDALTERLHRQFRQSIKGQIDAVVYNKIVLSPDWVGISKGLHSRYPHFNWNEPLLESRVGYFVSKKQWPECSKAIYDLLHNCGNQLVWPMINNMAWYDVFLHSSDRRTLRETIRWMRIYVSQSPYDLQALDTYANLLYKYGRKSEAITFETKANYIISQGTHSAKEVNIYKITLEKMQNGEKTWVGRKKDDTWE